MKKFSKRIIGFLVVAFVGILLVSCKNDKKFDVTFNANGGTLNSAEVVKVKDGEKLTLPEKPSREGYEFLGWFISDDEGVTLLREWKFDVNTVNSEMTLYASWEKVGADSITNVLNNRSNGDDVEVNGTVYFINSKGVYISDSELGKILVETTEDVELDDKLNVKGKLSVSNNQYKIEAKSVTVSSGTKVAPVEKALLDVVKLKNTSKTGSWYQYFKVSGILEKDDALQAYHLLSGVENRYLILNDEFGVEEFEAKLDDRVELEVVLTGYDAISNLWEVDYVVGTLEENLFSQEEIETLLEAKFEDEIPKTVLGGGLTLPSDLPVVKDLEITWTSGGTEIEIKELNLNNRYDTEINVPEEDTDVTLTATINYKDQPTFTIDVVITVQKLVKTSLKEAIESQANTAIFDAVVVGFAAGQTLSFKSYIVQDPVHPEFIITVDYDLVGETFGSYIDDVEIGDVLEFTAGYRDTGRPTFVEVDTKKTEQTQEPVYDLENAAVLNADTWNNYPGSNAFVKLEKPYMRYSTSGTPSITNWIRLGYGPNDVGVNYGPGNKSLAFLIRPVDELLGESWRHDLGITNVGEPGVLYDGDIYGFALYESSTYVQFVAVSKDHFIPSAKLQVTQELQGLIPLRIEEGNLVLPLTHDLVDGEFTWVSNDLDVISNDGTITYPETDTTVTLDVSFKVIGNEEVISLSFDVYVVGAVQLVLEVEEVFALSNDEFANVRGYVLQIGYSNSTTGTSVLDTIYLQDRVSGKILRVNGLENEFTEGNFKVADDISITGKVFFENDKVTFTYEEGLEVNASDVTLVDYRDSATEVTNHADGLVEFAKDFDYGQVYKFTGTIFFTSTTSSGDMTNLRFHLNPTASALSDVQYNGKSLVFNINSNKMVHGEDFAERLFGIEGNPGVARPGVAKDMTVYFAVKNESASYYYIQLINEDDVIFTVNEQVIIDSINALVPA